MRRGLFITFEGGEGAGKSTAIAAASALLTRRGIVHLTTREPGGTPFAEAMRSTILNPSFRGLSADAELLAMFSARADHVERMILPSLNAGRWVLSDRFTDASFAYQGGGRGVPVERIASLEQWAARGLRPDRTLLLDIPAGEGLQRARNRSEPDRMESEAVDFYDRVRQVYRDRAVAEPDRFVVLDATQVLEDVVAAVVRELESAADAWLGVPA
jgi:dTMP kinase